MSVSPPTAKQIMDASGISASYASMILGGTRVPPRALAIHIFRSFGWRHDSIGDLTDEQIAVLEQVEPWVAPAQRLAS
jgi:hypothetical protein